MAAGLSNPNPVVHLPSTTSGEEYDPLIIEIFGESNSLYVCAIFYEACFCQSDLIRDIKDPEHPHTLEELNVVKESDITLSHPPSHTSPAPSCTLQASSPRQPQAESGAVGVASAYADEDKDVWIRVQFTPTVPHCSLATLIGLCIRVKLERSLQRSFKLDVFVNEGSHSIEGDVNKQINDKERVAAAMENANLREMVEECIKEAEY